MRLIYTIELKPEWSKRLALLNWKSENPVTAILTFP